ncbi:ribosomal protein S27AE [Catenulispora sp. MAP12-49]|uniref:hypothetical protein n=1 Tax=unclassified Catenulispora TaxID=414885 RepID=UPI0035166362
MVEWSELKDSSGAADKIPQLLIEAGTNPESRAWTYLWARLSDARGVYSASYAALPSLAAIARSWPAADRYMPLSLAGSIVSWPDRPGGVDPFADYAAEIAEMRDLADLSLRSPEVDRASYVGILVALTYLQGFAIDTDGVENLGGSELRSTCPRCGQYNYVSLGDSGYFSTLDYGYLENSDVRRTPLIAAHETSLSGMAAHLLLRTRSDRRVDVQLQLKNFFGSVECGNCGLVFKMSEHVV